MLPALENCKNEYNGVSKPSMARSSTPTRLPVQLQQPGQQSMQLQSQQQQQHQSQQSQNSNSSYNNNNNNNSFDYLDYSNVTNRRNSSAQFLAPRMQKARSVSPIAPPRSAEPPKSTKSNIWSF